MRLLDGVPVAEDDSGRENCRQSVYQDLTVRRAHAGDAERITMLFRLVYSDSSHPFEQQGSISRFLADPYNVQIVAEHEGQIIASMAMTRCAWNNSYELGRAITHPDYRRKGLAAALMQQVVNWVCEQAWGEVFFGFPRVRRIVELCAGIDPPMVVAGHDAARNVANGSRETHLIVYSIPRYVLFHHVTPANTALMQSRFVQKALYEPLGLRPSPGKYPPCAFVGDVSQEALVIGDCLLGYSPDSPNRAVEIIGECVRPGRPVEISYMFSHLLRRLPGVEHITATVLADKAEVIASLCEIGFEVTAYLPAWYSLDGCRYDCVQLARRSHEEPSQTQGFEEMLAHLTAEFRSSVMPALTRPRWQPQRRDERES